MPVKWTELKEEEIMPAFDFLQMKLDIVGLDHEKKMMVLDLLKNRTRSQCYRLHKHFLKHSTTLEAIEDQPEMLSKEDWKALCAYWSDLKVQERCEINRNNRSKLSVLHNQGSRAFITLLNELIHWLVCLYFQPTSRMTWY
ncbi:hypothetical protein ACJIZ3_014130 [Penstemon smallii]|uniref:Uncharacterized protein n=1 Tax=Penstemon smallii TaxID=265156 RepID=A0ABD3RIM6_9LAMI